MYFDFTDSGRLCAFYLCGGGALFVDGQCVCHRDRFCFDPCKTYAYPIVYSLLFYTVIYDPNVSERVPVFFAVMPIVSVPVADTLTVHE